MQNLIRGIHDFQTREFPKRKKRFEELGGGQFPETLLITCSDSRIEPSLLTQTNPGELFIIRNAGNMVPAYGQCSSGEEATVEYAMKGLSSVTDIIVCGHSQCGAMGGLLNLDALTELPSVVRWLEQAQSTLDRVDETYDEGVHGDKLLYTVQINTLCQLENLRTHPAVADRLEAGTVSLHAWVYQFETGDVLAFDSDQADFVAVSETLVGETNDDSETIA